MLVKRPATPAAQAAAKKAIAAEGLEGAAATVGISAYLLARTALGQPLPLFSAEGIERRLAPDDSSAA